MKKDTGETHSFAQLSKDERTRFDALLKGFERGDNHLSAVAIGELQSPDSRFSLYLVEQAQAEQDLKGNCPAFALLYDRHYAEVVRYLAKMISNPEDQQHVAQETFLLASLNLPQARDETKWKFRRWLYKIAHNLAIDYIRRNEKEKRLCEELGQQIARYRQAEESLEEIISTRDLLHTAISRMTPCYRQALLTEITQSTTQSEKAASLSISESTFSGYISRGRSELHGIYQRLLQEAD